MFSCEVLTIVANSLALVGAMPTNSTTIDSPSGGHPNNRRKLAPTNITIAPTVKVSFAPTIITIAPTIEARIAPTPK